MELNDVADMELHKPWFIIIMGHFITLSQLKRKTLLRETEENVDT